MDSNLVQITKEMAAGVMEYYSKPFNIRTDWDGKGTRYVISVVSNVYPYEELEGSIIETGLEDQLETWDRAVAEFERLKTKYILSHG